MRLRKRMLFRIEKLTRASSHLARNDSLEDLVSQDDIVSTLTNLIDSDNLPHLLLYGPPGTGKVRCYDESQDEGQRYA